MTETNIKLFMALAMPALVCLGFSALVFEAGKPTRGYFAILGVRRSWISREIFAFVVFVLTATISGFTADILLQIIAIVAALALLFSQGFVLYESYGIPAWNKAIIPAFFLSSGLVSGAGLTMIVWTAMDVPPTMFVSILTIFLTLTNLAFWLLYVLGSKNLEFLTTTHQLRRAPSLTVMILIGHLLPVLILTFSLSFTRNDIAFEGNDLYIIISSSLLLIFTAWQKICIISNGYQRRISLRF